MTGSEVLNRVDKGYRMPKPNNEHIDCPNSMYDMMLKCWDHHPDSRPTFAFLYSYFDDFFVSAERSYNEQI